MEKNRLEAFSDGVLRRFLPDRGIYRRRNCFLLVDFPGEEKG